MIKENNPRRGEFYANYYPPASYDKQFELTQTSSEYYAIMVEKMGKQMADYYWNRRLSYEFDYLYEKECDEIIEKCNKFLDKRGALWKGY